MTNPKESGVKTQKATENEATETQELAKNDTMTVVVHPLVLLSVVDHFNRMSKIGNQKRVVGVLLGSWSSKTHLDISNSFAVPFDEDEKDATVSLNVIFLGFDKVFAVLSEGPKKVHFEQF